MPVNFVFSNQKHESEDKGEKKVDGKCVWCDHSGHNYVNGNTPIPAASG